MHPQARPERPRHQAGGHGRSARPRRPAVGRRLSMDRTDGQGLTCPRSPPGRRPPTQDVHYPGTADGRGPARRPPRPPAAPAAGLLRRPPPSGASLRSASFSPSPRRAEPSHARSGDGPRTPKADPRPAAARRNGRLRRPNRPVRAPTAHRPRQAAQTRMPHTGSRRRQAPDMQSTRRWRPSSPRAATGSPGAPWTPGSAAPRPHESHPHHLAVTGAILRPTRTGGEGGPVRTSASPRGICRSGR